DFHVTGVQTCALPISLPTWGLVHTLHHTFKPFASGGVHGVSLRIDAHRVQSSTLRHSAHRNALKSPAGLPVRQALRDAQRGPERASTAKPGVKAAGT